MAAIRRVVLFGPPGSGKGTYAKHLAPLLGTPGSLGAQHVSTGDLMRSEAERGTALGNELKACSRAGRLVPDDLVFALLEPILSTTIGETNDAGNVQPESLRDKCGVGPAHFTALIFDGFPRTVAQALELERRCPVDRVVAITMREDVLIRKSCARRVCPTCGVSFNLAHVDEPAAGGHDVTASDVTQGRFYMPAVLPTAPSCVENNCVERFVQREDDTEDVVRQRLEVFHRQSQPVLDFYRQLGHQDKHAHIKHSLVVDVPITGGFDVMAPVFERALDLS